MANSTNSLSRTKWLCKYHIVIVPKYRRKIIYNDSHVFNNCFNQRVSEGAEYTLAASSWLSI